MKWKPKPKLKYPRIRRRTFFCWNKHLGSDGYLHQWETITRWEYVFGSFFNEETSTQAVFDYGDETGAIDWDNGPEHIGKNKFPLKEGPVEFFADAVPKKGKKKKEKRKSSRKKQLK